MRQRTEREDEWLRSIPTGNLVVILQKLSKNVSHGEYGKPDTRSLILDEAARRLNEYRQKERHED